MPQCAFRHCKNNPRNKSVSEGISYFRFPGDPYQCEKWISIVATERHELFIPKKSSVICSMHFEEKDIVGNSQRRRLHKTAIPTLHIKSMPENTNGLDSDDSVSEIILSNVKTEPPCQNDVINEVLIKQEGIPRLETEPTCQNYVINEVLIKQEGVPKLETEPTCQNDVMNEVLIKQERIPKSEVMPAETYEIVIDNVCPSSPSVSLADLIPVSETRKEIYLKKKLERSQKVITNQKNKIRSLQNMNKRLIVKNDKFKNLIQKLKKSCKCKRTQANDILEIKSSYKQI